MNGNTAAFDGPIQINYRPPHWLFWFISFTHLGALVCLLIASLIVILKIAGVIVIATSFWLTYRLHIRRYIDSGPVQLVLDKKDRWFLISPDKEGQEVNLYSSSIIHPQLIVLVLKVEGNKKRSFILTNSNVDEDTLRRLRVRLRHPIS